MPVLVDSPSELGAIAWSTPSPLSTDTAGRLSLSTSAPPLPSSRVSERRILGGIISPGLGISADALFSRAARLARVDIKRPPKVIGTTTVTHIQSGLYYGYIGLVDGILERMIAETAASATAGAKDPRDRRPRPAHRRRFPLHLHHR